MTKSPNTDNKRHRQARNCLRCDNGDRVHYKPSQCHCAERSRAADKRRAVRDIAEEWGIGELLDHDLDVITGKRFSSD